MDNTPSNSKTPQDLTPLLIEAVLADRKAERRSRNIKSFLIGAFAFGYLGLMSLTYIANQEETLEAGSYASMVKINGEIGPGKPASFDVLKSSLDRAFSDKGAKGVVLVVNSPGGTPVQSSLINQHIKHLKKQHSKPVVVVGQDMLTSGAYMIAVAGDKIYANESSIVGSIGVISRRFGFVQLMDKLGVESRTITAGDSKNLGDPFEPVKAESDAQLKVLITGIHDEFISDVKESRGSLLSNQDEKYFTGKVWTGRDAQKVGIIDHVGTAQEAIVAEFGVAKTKEYRPSSSLLSGLFKDLNVKSLFKQDESAPVDAKWGLD